MELHKYLDYYLFHGFATIPAFPKTKIPIVKWKEWQEIKPPIELVRNWFDGKELNIAIVCGKSSGNLAVFDFDIPKLFEDFYKEMDLDTIIVKTGRGYHVYIRTEKPLRSRKFSELFGINAQGTYVIAPPSVHPSGVEYKFENTVDTIPVLPLNKINKWTKEFEESEDYLFFKRRFIWPYREHPPCIKKLLEGVKEGFRNEAGMRIAGYFRCRVNPKTGQKYGKDDVLNLLLKWNKRNNPPLPEKEIYTIVDHVFRVGYNYGCNKYSEICRSVNPSQTCPLWTKGGMKVE